MAQKLIIPIIADPTGFKRGIAESSKYANEFDQKIKASSGHLGSFSKEMDRSGRGALAGSGLFQGLGRSVAFASAAFLGSAGLIAAVKSSVSAAENYTAALNSTDQAVRATGGSVAAYRSQLSQLATAGAKLGFTNTDVLGGLKTLTLVTGNATDAVKYMGLAEDIARAKGVPLQSVATAIGKAIDGKTASLQRYGVVATKGESVEQLLADATRKYAGQAVASTTVTERLHATMTNLEQKIGAALLPTIERLATRFENWIGQAKNAKMVTDAVTTALKDLELIMRGLKSIFDAIAPQVLKLKNYFGDWKPIIVGVGAALVALGVLSPWTALAVGALYVITHWAKVKGWFNTFWGWLKTGFQDALDVIKGLFYGWVAAVIGYLKLLADGAAAALGWLPGIGGKLKEAARTIDGFYADFKNKSIAAFSDIGKASADAWSSAYMANVQSVQSTGGSTGTAGPRAPGGGTTSGGRYSQSQVYDLLIRNGVPAGVAQNLARISQAESGGRVGALNNNPATGDYSVGLFQENFLGQMGVGRTRRYAPQFGQSPNESPQMFVEYLRNHPDAQAKIAYQIFQSQGYGAWTTAAGLGIHGGPGGSGGGGGMAPASYGPPSSTTKKPPAYKLPQALEARIRLAQQSFASDVSKSHLETLDVLYRQEESLLKAHGQDAKAASVANEITKAGEKFQKMLAALHLKVAQATIAKIEAESTGPAQSLALAQAAGLPVAEILVDQRTLLGSYQTEAAQLKAHLGTATGKAKAAYQSALTKVQSSVVSTQDSIVQSLQSIAASAQQGLQTVIGSIETAADQQLGKQFSQGGLQTPAEALLSAMQAEDTKKQLQDALTQAITAGDPAAIDAAQRAITESDLATQATKERAAADAAYAKAEWNLNSQIEKLSQNIGTGAGAQGKLNALLGQFGISLGDLSDPGGHGLLTQLQAAVDATTTAFWNLNKAMGGPGGSQAGGGAGAAPGTGSASVATPAQQASLAAQGWFNPRSIPGFASGGLVPGSLGAPMLAVVHGGETVTPAGAGGGVTNNYFSFPNYVGSKQEIAAVVAKELNRNHLRGTPLLGQT